MVSRCRLRYSDQIGNDFGDCVFGLSYVWVPRLISFVGRPPALTLVESLSWSLAHSIPLGSWRSTFGVCVVRSLMLKSIACASLPPRAEQRRSAHERSMAALSGYVSHPSVHYVSWGADHLPEKVCFRISCHRGRGGSLAVGVEIKVRTLPWQPSSKRTPLGLQGLWAT